MYVLSAAGEPLLLANALIGRYVGAAPDDAHFELCYVKGAARATTLLFLAHVAWKAGWDLPTLCPRLQASMTACHIRLHGVASDAISVCLENARLSARGAICKAHDVLTWVLKLAKLKPAGVKPSEVLKRWNAECTKDSQLLGAKRTAVLNLLDAPESAIQILMEHLSEFGLDGVAFREDCFSSKKLSVGFQPRSGLQKPWQDRLKVTAEGLTLTLCYLHEAHKRKCPESRVKLDRKAVEEAQQMAQLLLAGVQEAQAQYPLSQEAVQEHILGPFVAGDMNLEMELQSALSELPTDWRSLNLTHISRAVQTHCDVRDTAMMRLTGQGLSIEAGQLEQQAFALVLQALKHDIACYQVWRTRCSDRESAIYFASLQHLTERQKKAREIALSTYDAQRSPNWRFMFIPFGSEVGQAISDVNAMYTAIQSITKKDAATTLIILNWSSPGTFSAEVQRAQAAIMGSLMK